MIAVLIQCHRPSPSLHYTVKKLATDPRIQVYIHVDKKSDLDQFAYLIGPRVALIPNRTSVSWGGISQVEATINLVTTALNCCLQFDYATLISGDDILIKSTNEFLDFLTYHKKAKMEFIGIQRDRYGFLSPFGRVQYLYPSIFHTKKPTLINRIQRKIFRAAFMLGAYRNNAAKQLPPLYKGSSWFTLSRECLIYISKYLQNNPSFLAAFRHSYCCDEVVFQTILMNNSEYRSKIFGLQTQNKHMNDNESSLHYIDWSSGPTYPKEFSTSELTRKFEGPIFFIRKTSKDVTTSDLTMLFH